MAVRIANKTMTNDNRKEDDGGEDDATCADDNGANMMSEVTMTTA